MSGASFSIFEDGQTSVRAVLLAGLALVGLLFWTYWPVLSGLVAQWWNEDDYSHGFLIPLVSLFLVWIKKDELLAMPFNPARSGFLILGLSLAVYVTGSVGAEIFLQRLSLIGMIGGIVLTLLGWRILGAVAFPIGYLVTAVPLPGILFDTVAFPLQLIAAKIATSSMQGCGVPVLREGNIMHLATISLDVEEACSGIRSLLSLTALGVLYGYLTEDRWLFRSIIVLSVVPIAVAANVFRVTVTGFMAHYVSPQSAQGFFHGVGGMSIFVISLLLLFGVSAGLKVSKRKR